MTLKEAVESGKELRREGFTTWFNINQDGKLIDLSDGSLRPIRAKDIVATDWEIRK